MHNDKRALWPRALVGWAGAALLLQGAVASTQAAGGEYAVAAPAPNDASIAQARITLRSGAATDGPYLCTTDGATSAGPAVQCAGPTTLAAPDTIVDFTIEFLDQAGRVLAANSVQGTALIFAP
jgi:hypothetical protein